MKIADPAGSPTISSSIERHASQPQGNQKGPEFAVGDLLKARILQIQENGNILLQVKGQTFSARSLVSLNPGDELWLEVRAAGDSPLLALAGKKGAAHEFIKNFFFHVTSKEGLLDRFSSSFPLSQNTLTAEENLSLGRLFLHLLSSVTSEKPDADAVKLMALLYGAVRHPQGKTESAVSDLFKEISIFSSVSKNRVPKFFKEAVEDTFKTAEMHQQLNSSRASLPGEAPFYLFPCFFAREESWGEWIFSLREESGPEKEFSLDFYLEMSRMGPISFHLESRDTSMRGEFRMGGEEVRIHMEKQLPELKRILGNLGYDPVLLRCLVSEHNTPEEIKKKLTSKAGLHTFSLLDVTA